MATDFELSPYGYWISPEGEVTAMSALGGHGAWMRDSGLFAGADNTSAKDAAVQAGWLKVTIPPDGDQWGLSYRRQDTLDKRAVMALLDVIKAAGHKDLPIQAGLEGGIGSRFVWSLVSRTHDRTKWSTPGLELDYAQATHRQMLASLCLLRRQTAELETGAKPDYAGLRGVLKELEPLFLQGYKQSYALWPALYKNTECAGSVELLRAAARPLLMELVAIDADIVRLCARAGLLLYGMEAPPAPQACEMVSQDTDTPDNASPLLAARIGLEALRATMIEASREHRAVLEALPNQAQANLVEVIRTLNRGVKTYRVNLDHMERAMLDSGMDANGLLRKLSFYAGHENGALYSAYKAGYVERILAKVTMAETSIAPLLSATPSHGG